MLESCIRIIARFAIQLCGQRIIYEEVIKASIAKQVSVSIIDVAPDDDADDEGGLDVWRKGMEE